MPKRTPLFEAHQRLGGRLVDFHGWEMPIQYSGIVDEHQAVRTAAGLFDISHMGEVEVTGPGALRFLNRVLTNDLNKLRVGQGQYTLICQKTGGVIDDLYVYRLEEESYLLIINAARADVDLKWLREAFQLETADASTQLHDRSDAFAALALQGPKAAEVIDSSVPEAAIGGMRVTKPSNLEKNQVGLFPWRETPIWISRTGYTGEDGFEILSPPEAVEGLWEKLLEVGRPFGLKPAGLGARDTLRTEACLPLYGHELDESTTPLEAGLSFAVSLAKEDLIGREALEKQKAEGVSRRCIAFKVLQKAPPPRAGYAIWDPESPEKPVGQVTSGTQSPTLGMGIGLGFVPPRLAKLQTPLEIEIRGRRYPAAVAAKPLHRKAT